MIFKRHFKFKFKKFKIKEIVSLKDILSVNHKFQNFKTCFFNGHDDAFFNQIGLESIGVIGPEIGLLLGLSAGSECDTPLQKQERRWVSRGFARGRSDA